MRRTICAALLGLCLGTVAPSVALGERSNEAIDIVILVDESQSLSRRDVEAERAAVAQFVSLPILIDRDIRITIAPFSSGPRSPRTLEGCNLTPLTSDTVDLLAGCSTKVQRQTKNDADDTDFAAAIDFATDILGAEASAGRTHAVILMTDGQYDPDGNENVSAKEQAALDKALARAKENDVSIWAIGFGKAQLGALKSYVDAGAQPREDCDPLPEPKIVRSVSLLADEVTKFVTTIGCGIDVVTGSPTPSTYKVHPFMETLAVSVTGSADDIPVLTDSEGKEVCAGSWQKIGVIQNCKITLDGSRPGTWTVRTSKPAKANWMSEGQIDGALADCTNQPVLSIFREDKKPIDWASTNEWPSVTGYLVDDTGQTLKEFSLVADKPAIDVDASGVEGATRLEFTLDRNGDTAPKFKLVKRISCDLVAVPVTSSPSVPPTTNPATTATTGATTTTVSAGTPDGDGSSAWVWLLVILGAAGAVFGGYKWYRSRLFPPGTVVLQESRDRPGTFIELDGEVSGKRRVSLLNSGGRFLDLEPYAKSADITLTRAGEQVRVQYPLTSPGEEGDEVVINEELVPFGIALTVQGFVIRVDVPVGLDEDEDEDGI